jgi:hypothetical protein
VVAALWLSFALAEAAAPPLTLPRDIGPADRARLESVARDALVSTRVEGPTHFMRPEVFEYLLDHPEFATHLTRALGLARYRIWHDSAGLWLDDGWGTQGRFTLIRAAPGQRLYYAHGAYEQRFLPSMRGEAVAILDYRFRPEDDGRTLVASWATGYVQVDSRFLRALGKLALPFVQAKADKEAVGLLRLFARASRAIENNSAQVYLKVSERPDVPRRELEEFRELLRLP